MGYFLWTCSFWKAKRVKMISGVPVPGSEIPGKWVKWSLYWADKVNEDRNYTAITLFLTWFLLNGGAHLTVWFSWEILFSLFSTHTSDLPGLAFLLCRSFYTVTGSIREGNLVSATACLCASMPKCLKKTKLSTDFCILVSRWKIWKLLKIVLKIHQRVCFLWGNISSEK